MRKKRVKQKTTLPKIRRSAGRLKGAELPVRGSTKDVIGASQADSLSGGQRGREVENQRRSGLTAKTSTNLPVPVVDKNNVPQMPTTCSRAKRWIKTGKATGFWKKGIYCVRLNVEPSGRIHQPIAVGIDPGSKKEGITVKSASRTYLNTQADAVTWVKENVETRRNLRRSRRSRTTPCRKNKWYRLINTKRIPPSTKARWQWKLRVVDWLRSMYPITNFVVENIAAKTKEGKRKWNASFSPLEVGKKWFYAELRKLGSLTTKEGWETCELRKQHGLQKTKNKKAEVFEAHCVDSWVLANAIVGGHTEPDNKTMLFVTPLRFFRRQLHVQNSIKGGIRKNYGGTMSMGFKRGSIVTHKKHGLTFIGGTSKGKVSLHSVQDGKRLTQNASPSDIKFLAYNSFLTRRSGNSSHA